MFYFINYSMKVAVRISEYISEGDNVLIHEPLELFEIPLSEHSIHVGNSTYTICQTLFLKETLGYEYGFEQIAFLKNGLGYNPDEKYYLVEGSVWFENEESSLLLRDLSVRIRHDEIKISLPYSYLRIYDCILIGQLVYRIMRINLTDKGGTYIEAHHTPKTIEQFRADENLFCRSRGRAGL